MIQLLKESPLLLLLIVAALGFLVGRIKIKGFSLGVAAVLFVGLGVGALDPELKLPDFVYLFGLVLFVYTVGLSSGPGFFASFRRRGLRDNAFALALLTAGAGIVAVAAALLHLRGPLAAGLFTGASTNTPALAAVIERLAAAVPAPSKEAVLAPVVAYSVAYPMGVLGVLGAIYIVERALRIDYDHEPRSRRDAEAMGVHLSTVTLRITQAEALGVPARELRRSGDRRVAFGRLKRGERFSIVADEDFFQVGDLVTVIGDPDDIAAVAPVLGEIAAEHIELDRRFMDFRRMFVSNPEVTERPLGGLDLVHRFGAVITRVRRGDVELLPDEGTVLELGDRVRVVAPPARMGSIAAFLGDSYKALSEVDVLTFSVGIAAGLLLGLVPIPLPGGTVFKLGSAGGPLVVGLLLGYVGRTGGVVWTLPYSAGLTLRQLGLVLFLAGVGTRSGHVFASTLSHGGALALFCAGTVTTMAIALGALLLGYRLLRIPMGTLVGMLAGIQTQPAVLAFAVEQTHNDLPNVGYATVYPLATIGKIFLAQLLLGFFGS
jgi:putative transport protein